MMATNGLLRITVHGVNMNERIKELSGKALDKAVPYTWTKLDYEQIQKLLACHAELIVLECVDYCSGHILPADLAKENDLTYNDGIGDCAIGLIQHYGLDNA